MNLKLYAVATYAVRGIDEKFWLGIYFAFAHDEDQAIEAAITHCKAVDPSFDAFHAEATEAPVDEEMLPRIQEIIKARQFLEGAVMGECR